MYQPVQSCSIFCMVGTPVKEPRLLASLLQHPKKYLQFLEGNRTKGNLGSPSRIILQFSIYPIWGVDDLTPYRVPPPPSEHVVHQKMFSNLESGNILEEPGALLFSLHLRDLNPAHHLTHLIRDSYGFVVM